MTLSLLFMAPARRWFSYRETLPPALAAEGIEATLSPEADPGSVDYIVYGPGDPAATDFTRFPRLKAVLGLWAGVETIVGNPTLTVPLTRMVDPGMTAGMVEYVVAHTLRFHIGMDAHLHNPGRRWVQVTPPLASERPVTVLGLGELGAASARALAGLGFPVTGWSRTPRDIPGVRCLSGEAGLAEALDRAGAVILLVPLTPATEGLLNAERLARLAPGALVLNPGRGPLVDDAALLAALDSGQVGHATLDVFRTEPLPQDHPFWAHPRVTVTPHIASETRPATASQVIARNIARAEAGEPLLHLVDRARGY